MATAGSTNIAGPGRVAEPEKASSPSGTFILLFGRMFHAVGTVHRIEHSRAMRDLSHETHELANRVGRHLAPDPAVTGADIL